MFILFIYLFFIFFRNYSAFLLSYLVNFDKFVCNVWCI